MAESWESERDPSLEKRLGGPMSSCRGDSLEASWSGDSVSDESAELLINGGSSSPESYELTPTPVSCPPGGEGSGWVWVTLWAKKGLIRTSCLAGVVG